MRLFKNFKHGIFRFKILDSIKKLWSPNFFWVRRRSSRSVSLFKFHPYFFFCKKKFILGFLWSKLQMMRKMDLKTSKWEFSKILSMAYFVSSFWIQLSSYDLQTFFEYVEDHQELFPLSNFTFIFFLQKKIHFGILVKQAPNDA